METIFTLPLFILACIQAVLSLLLLAPAPVSLPTAQVISKLRKTTAVQSALITISVLLAGLFFSSFLELTRGADRVRSGDVRGDLMGTIDYLRAQVSCVLAVLNLLLVLLNPALADEKKQHDHQTKNLEAMKRQVKGLQTEYERVTAKPASGQGAAGSGPASEAEEWKRKVDKLIREKGEMQDSVDAANKGKAAAEARVEAMLKQIKGFDAEYDRVLDENKQLKRRLAQVDPAQAGGQHGVQEGSKKDD
mmetsp:Transcript_31470/g.70061  ORF Transcript_31470/g.70061 Transcript_31470/m.70061 type:complete len:249 (-) Transcript_31470:7-753(-)